MAGFLISNFTFKCQGVYLKEQLFQENPAMPYQERTDEEIIAAYERWVARTLKADRLIFMWDGEVFTPRSIAFLLKGKNPTATRIFIGHLRTKGQKENRDPVTEIVDNFK